MKKLLCIVLMFMFIMSVTAYAFPLEPVPQCPSCGRATVIVSSNEGLWEGPIAQRECIHGQGGYDLVYSQTIEKQFFCENCGRYLLIPQKINRWFCQGIITQN